jgi:hypothetical protein
LSHPPDVFWRTSLREFLFAMDGPGEREKDAPTRDEYEQLKARVAEEEQRRLRLATKDGERVS